MFIIDYWGLFVDFTLKLLIFLTVDLKKLADSDNPDVKAAADGALWKIEGESKHINKLSNKKLLENQPAGGKCVFLYQTIGNILSPVMTFILFITENLNLFC